MFKKQNRRNVAYFSIYTYIYIYIPREICTLQFIQTCNICVVLCTYVEAKLCSLYFCRRVLASQTTEYIFINNNID